MAKYPPLDPERPARLIYGVGFWVTPTDPQQPVDIERAPDSGGSPDTGAAETIVEQRVFSRRGGLVLDPLPGDNTFRHYRFRHAFPGATPGAWSAWVKARPDIFDEDLSSIYPLRREQPMADGGYALRAGDAVGKEAFDDLFVGDTKTLKVGTAGSPSVLSKTVRVGYGELLPASSSTLWGTSTGYIHAGGAGSHKFYASVVLPAGVTITDVAARLYKNGAPDVVSATLYRVGDSGTWTSIASMIYSGGSGWATAAATLSELVGANAYVIEVDLQPNATGTDARFAWYDITYDMPSYDKGI